MTFRFKDGSIHEETAVFTQRGQFRLVSDHLVQKGPTFPNPLDVSIDATTGQVAVRSTDEDGESKTESERLELPPDLANGLILTLLKNVSADAPPKSFSFVAATPKPRLVKLELQVAGRERFSTGGAVRTATHYVLKVDIGGLSGLLAPLLGKQPPDSHVWILGGEAPAFVKSEQPLYFGGPIWRIELSSPVWPRQSERKSQSAVFAALTADNFRRVAPFLTTIPMPVRPVLHRNAEPFESVYFLNEGVGSIPTFHPRVLFWHEP